jgi:RNA polymerase sigma-70 factor (ECF subfamily)
MPTLLRAERAATLGPLSGSGNGQAVQEDRVRALIEQIAARADPTAFAELFRYFAPRLKAYCLRSGANAATAEELAQEAMIQIWRKAATFDGSRNTASAWVYAIARNKRIDLLRRERRPDPVTLDPWPDPPADENVETAFALGEWSRGINDAVGRLPADQAEVLRKAYFEDKSHSVIAAELNLPLGTVKSRVRLGLARLKDMMAGWEA